MAPTGPRKGGIAAVLPPYHTPKCNRAQSCTAQSCPTMPNIEHACMPRPGPVPPPPPAPCNSRAQTPYHTPMPVMPPNMHIEHACASRAQAHRPAPRSRPIPPASTSPACPALTSCESPAAFPPPPHSHSLFYFSPPSALCPPPSGSVKTALKDCTLPPPPSALCPHALAPLCACLPSPIHDGCGCVGMGLDQDLAGASRKA
jgi:hypothetical protein